MFSINEFEFSLKIDTITAQDLPPIRVLLQQYLFTKITIFTDIEETNSDERSLSRSKICNKSSCSTQRRDNSNLRSTKSQKSKFFPRKVHILALEIKKTKPPKAKVLYDALAK